MKFRQELEYFPHDWRTTIRCNVGLAIFQHHYIYQGPWKNARSTFQGIVIHQSKGEGPNFCQK